MGHFENPSLWLPRSMVMRDGYIYSPPKINSSKNVDLGKINCLTPLPMVLLRPL